MMSYEASPPSFEFLMMVLKMAINSLAFRSRETSFLIIPSLFLLSHLIQLRQPPRMLIVRRFE
jgi:hypothetical protein